jgi:hypothetical protein
MMRKNYTLKGGQGCLPGSKGCAPGSRSLAARFGNYLSGLSRRFTTRRLSNATKREIAATAAAEAALNAAKNAATRPAKNATARAAAVTELMEMKAAANRNAEMKRYMLDLAAEQKAILEEEPPDLNDGAPGLMQGYGPRKVLQTKNPIQPKKSPTAAAKWALKEAELAAQVADAAEAQVEKINLKSLTKREKEEITDAAHRLRAQANRVAKWAESWVAFAARKEMEAQEAAAAEAAIMAAEAAALAEEVSSGAAARLKAAADKLDKLLYFKGRNSRKPVANLTRGNKKKNVEYRATEKEIKAEYLKALKEAPLTAIKRKEAGSGREYAAQPKYRK